LGTRRLDLRTRRIVRGCTGLSLRVFFLNLSLGRIGAGLMEIRLRLLTGDGVRQRGAGEQCRDRGHGDKSHKALPV